MGIGQIEDGKTNAEIAAELAASRVDPVVGPEATDLFVVLTPDLIEVRALPGLA